MNKIGNHLRAHFVAYIALFFALGGTSMAAVQALPRGSVGTKQLKRNAVIGSKVKNNSLQGVDILESSLARVPSAGRALSADRATGAETAKTASIARTVIDQAINGAKVADGSLAAVDVASVTGTFTDDAPSIPADACVTRTPTGLTGVQTGDVLLVTPPPEASFNVLETPIVIMATQGASDGSIRLHICNTAPTAFNPPPYRYRYMAFH
jgi:hypothetical protein